MEVVWGCGTEIIRKSRQLVRKSTGVREPVYGIGEGMQFPPKVRNFPQSTVWICASFLIFRSEVTPKERKTVDQTAGPDPDPEMFSKQKTCPVPTACRKLQVENPAFGNTRKVEDSVHPYCPLLA